jgi:hypothetical protein
VLDRLRKALSSEELAHIHVPGEARVELPAGKVKVRYVEDREGRDTRPNTGKPVFPGPPDELEITLTPDGGEPIVVERTSRVQAGMGGGVIHRLYGSVELTAAGTYTVVAATPGLSAEREALMYNARLSLRD